MLVAAFLFHRATSTLPHARACSSGPCRRAEGLNFHLRDGNRVAPCYNQPSVSPFGNNVELFRLSPISFPCTDGFVRVTSRPNLSTTSACRLAIGLGSPRLAHHRPSSSRSRRQQHWHSSQNHTGIASSSARTGHVGLLQFPWNVYRLIHASLFR